MLINNTRDDLKYMLKESGVKTFSNLAVKMGISRAAVSTKVKSLNHVSRAFLRMCDALGYDVRLQYIKKEDTSDVLNFVTVHELEKLQEIQLEEEEKLAQKAKQLRNKVKHSVARSLEQDDNKPKFF